MLKRTGYAFLGWYREASFKTKVESTTKVTATANHTLYARWSANTYLVTFSSQGGTSVASINVIYDGTYGTMVTPSRNGYTFLGWFTAIEGGTQVKSGDKVTITKNQTLYAHWKGNTITVKFDANGGSNSTSSKGYVVGNKYTDLPTPSAPAGYIFDAWYTAKKGGNKITSSSTVSPSYTTLYAQYKARNYTVTYDSVGGSSVAQVQVTYGNTYGSAYSNKTLPKPQKDRYEFVGWYTAANNGSLVTASSKVATAKNHTLYARWKVAKVEVKFDSNGGKGDVPSQIYTIGEEYKKLPVGPTPAKSYWSFDGWYTAKIGGEKIQTSTIVSSSNDTRTLYAHYVYDFFSEKSWLKLEPAKTSKTIPFNSVIQRQKGITIADYQAIFDDRLKEYKSADDTADEYYADLLQRVMKVDTVIGLAGIGCPVASDLYFHYRYGNGDLLEYDASHFILGTDLGLAEFKRYTLDIMKRMEKLVPGQKVTFVDENTGSRDYVNFIPDPLYDISEWDSHYAVRAAWLGPSGSCVFDGSTYKLDLYFYVQDYYHFYYPKNVAERKAGLGLNGIGYIVQNDELAFLVIRGYAKPFESCGVYHVSLDWEKGQNVENVLDEYIFISRF